jgi:hypothetical protein
LADTGPPRLTTLDHFVSELANVMARYAVALHNIQDRILAQPEPAADFPIRLAFADEL